MWGFDVNIYFPKAACHLNCSVPEVLIADGTNLSLDEYY